MERVIRKFGRLAYRAVFILATVLGLSALSACSGSGSRVVFTTGFGKDEVFRIEDVKCLRAELMVYLVTAQNRYESVFGPEIWSLSREGVTLEENVKDTVLAKIAQVKTMCLLARDRELELDARETALAEQAAAEYFSSLTETEIALLKVTEEDIAKMYAEYALANKVYRDIIGDVNPEISDDEARTITVQHIMLRTWMNDGSGARVDYADDVKQSVYEKVCGIREMAVEEGQDFLELASRYSDDTDITFSFGKGEMDPAFEEAAFSLATNEISQVVETKEGYHIIKCINTFDREQTDLSKLEIVEERRKEAFGEVYDAFAEPLVRQLNGKLWEEIALVHDEELTTVNFFDVYEKHFAEP